MLDLAIGFGAAMIMQLWDKGLALSVGTRRKPSPLGTTNESLLLFAPGGLGGGAGFCRCLGGGPGGGAGFCSFFLGGGPGGGAGPSSFGAALVEELGSGAALVSFGGTNNCCNCAALAFLVASRMSLIFFVISCCSS